MTDREVMQQALDALSPWAGEDANHTEQYASYNALRERLAQPEKEPVGHADLDINNIYIFNEFEPRVVPAGRTPLCTRGL